MLQTLYIKNYALINETRVEFHNGLVTITGETGAGKSILLGALGLIIGNRADTTVLRDKEIKCIVEAVFDISLLSLKNFFVDHELDYEELCIVRREILPGGKSRAFVNDSPVQLNILKNLGSLLIDIHSQHETLQLRDENFQIETLDLFSENGELLDKYRMILKNYRDVEKELNELKEREARIRSEHEFISFQYKELLASSLTEGEQEQLEAELSRGENAEEIKGVLSSAINEISESESNLVGRIYSLKNALQKLSEYDTEIKQASVRLEQVYHEMNDIVIIIEHVMDTTDFDPKRKLLVEERLDLIYTLQKKHRVSLVADLLRIMLQMEDQLLIGSNFDAHIVQLEVQMAKHKIALLEMTEALHLHRVNAAGSLEKEIVKVLKTLGIEDAKLSISIESVPQMNKYGADKIKYLFSANKGMIVEDVNKVASGGEISRLMLAIKALVSNKKNQPTIIFDEIDAGVSGNIADKLGNVMKDMAQHQQVIAITHLPQIASKGSLHIKVEKSELNKKTVSNLTALSEKERIAELATMLSGSDVTEEAIKNAKVLLGVQ